jgi:adenine-specific DNA-methyltransferase
VSRLNDLLRRVENSDPALAKDLKREVDALADRRAFGLNFERHAPEAVELPGRPVRRADKVRIIPPRGSKLDMGDLRLWRVAAIAKDSLGMRTATLELMGDESETTEALVDDLVVVAEFRDPIYPGLVSTGKVERGGDKPFHAVINAENYHALQTLLFTHRAKVDVIYIDPPYNTGNEDWIYNDKYVSGDDSYRHSKWLAFMERRLLLAKELLKPTGVIIIAIGDEEHHRLRLLMDQIFGGENFLADVVWQGRVKNDRRFTGGGADYMLIFARSQSKLVEIDARWKEPTPGVSELLARARSAFDSALADGLDNAQAAAAATKSLREWIRANKGEFAGGLLAYQNVDEHGRVFQPGPLDSPNPRPNLVFDVVHPVTGEPVPTPVKGWRVSREVMAQMVSNGQVVWGKDHTTGIRRKLVLADEAHRVPAPTFMAERDTATRHLREILGEQRFPNPKPVDVLMRWIRIMSGEHATVLDFFGGSGSTAEAVLLLNKEDGGNRRCILVTNNEAAVADAKALSKRGKRPGDPEWEAKGVYEFVTKPRIRAVANGVREDGSRYSDGLNENVEFFKLTYEAPLRVSSNREFAKIAPLLWLRAGSKGRRIDDIASGWDVSETYGVLADLNQSDAFVEAIARPGIRIAFIVTDEDRLFEAVVRELPNNVEAVRLYEAYLHNFEIETGRSAL